MCSGGVRPVYRECQREGSTRKAHGSAALCHRGQQPAQAKTNCRGQGRRPLMPCVSGLRQTPGAQLLEISVLPTSPLSLHIPLPQPRPCTPARAPLASTGEPSPHTSRQLRQAWGSLSHSLVPSLQADALTSTLHWLCSSGDHVRFTSHPFHLQDDGRFQGHTSNPRRRLSWGLNLEMSAHSLALC